MRLERREETPLVWSILAPTLAIVVPDEGYVVVDLSRFPW